jgi:hypothetical protein
MLSWYLNTRAMPTRYEFGKMIRIILPAVAIYLLNLQLETWEMEQLGCLRAIVAAASPLLYLVAIMGVKLMLLVLYLPAVVALGVFEPEDRWRMRQFYNDLKSRVAARSRAVPPPETHLE